jgi:hypothetical protein
VAPSDAKVAIMGEMQEVTARRRRVSKKAIHRGARYILGGGSLVYGLAATLRTDKMAAIMAEDEEEVRRLAMRDLSSGVNLLTSRSLRPLLARLRYDIGDSLALLRKKPRLAPLALAAVLLGVVAILTRE